MQKHSEPSADRSPEDPCSPACNLIATERNRYFTGKYLAARDFRDEQAYFLSRHRLHNRLLHGWGIVCGLEVRPHPDPNCADQYVVVTPGIAIDCCGREVVLNQKTVVKVWEPAQTTGADTGRPGERPGAFASSPRQTGYEPEPPPYEDLPGQPSPQTPGDRPGSQRAAGPFLLYLHYCEECTELAPALYAEDACDPKRLEANRIREAASLTVLLWDEAQRKATAGCWPEPEMRENQEWPCHEDDCEGGTQEKAGCLEPKCPCTLGVPLALITPKAYNDVYTITEEDIDIKGRHELQTAPGLLTHIVGFNWTHGGTMPLSKLREMEGKLKVYFDRRLWDRPADGDGIGVNEHTFTVHYHVPRDTGYSVQVLYNDDIPPTVENGCVAVLTIDDRWLGGRANIGDSILYVTLKCDFILDYHGRPVDGNHLGGQWPTGDDVPGGTFESWFYVVDDEEWRRDEGRRSRQEERKRQEAR